MNEKILYIKKSKKITGIFKFQIIMHHATGKTINWTFFELKEDITFFPQNWKNLIF